MLNSVSFMLQHMHCVNVYYNEKHIGTCMSNVFSHAKETVTMLMWFCECEGERLQDDC